MLPRSGDRTMISTEQVWQELSTQLRHFIRRRVADEQLAEDLLQESFLRIHNSIVTLTDHDRLAAWVYRIARNTIADYFRQGARPAEEAPSPHVSEAEDASDRNYNAAVAQWLVHMVQRLPDTYREAVQLAELEGMTQRDVSERLNLSVSGAKSRVQRGREKLKQMLLRCCHIELDRRGNVVDYRSHAGCGCEACCAE
jgi:RNA polymerase sigma-70 factor, ECF subfamily